MKEIKKKIRTFFYTSSLIAIRVLESRLGTEWHDGRFQKTTGGAVRRVRESVCSARRHFATVALQAAVA